MGLRGSLGCAPGFVFEWVALPAALALIKRWGWYETCIYVLRLQAPSVPAKPDGLT